jgi:uncharacterized protein
VETIVPKGTYKIVYEGKDITADIVGSVIDFTYEDKEAKASDTIELRVDDTDAKWRNAWYPKKGDKITASIGKGETLVECGTFKVDEIELDGPPDTVTIRAIAATFTTKMRTKKSKAHEKQTLKQIAQSVAADNGLTLQGEVENIKIERVTQNDETDLNFLRRIADDYGYAFSIRDTKLIFTSIYKLEDGKAVRTIDRTELSRYQLRDKSTKTYKSAKVSYHNPVENKVVTYETEKATNKDGVSYNTIGAADTLVIKSKVENKQQAEAKAKAALYKANSKQQEGTLTVPGDPLLLAGNNFELTGMGEMSGKFHIETSVHRVSRYGGYTTALTVKRVKASDKKQNKSRSSNKNAVSQASQPSPAPATGTPFKTAVIFPSNVTPYNGNSFRSNGASGDF